MINKVFVYGTLKKGNTLRGIDKFGDAEFVGHADTTDSQYNMYTLGSFPAVTMDGKNKVSGEVWEVGEETFQVLDQIEGYPDFYDRSVISTTAGDAWIYHIPDIKNFRAEQLSPIRRGVLAWIK